jgi:hypothetical protein
MHNLILLPMVILANFWNAAHAASKDDFVMRLIQIASDRSQPAQVQAAALAEISNLGAKGLGTKTADTVAALKTLLTDPRCNLIQADFVRLHVAQALASIGPAARDALPAFALLERSGVKSDPTLKAALASAVAAITKAEPETAAQPAAEAPTAPTLDGLRRDLANESAAVRLAALKKLWDQKEKALPVLGDIADRMKSGKGHETDSDVRRLAAEATRDILDTLTNDAAKDEWTRVYVDNLADMLQTAHDTQERLFAVVALAELASKFAKAGKICPCATGALRAVEDAENPYVQAIAKAALTPPKQPAPAGGPAKSTDPKVPQPEKVPKGDL